MCEFSVTKIGVIQMFWIYSVHKIARCYDYTIILFLYVWLIIVLAFWENMYTFEGMWIL